MEKLVFMLLYTKLILAFQLNFLYCIIVCSELPIRQEYKIQNIELNQLKPKNITLLDNTFTKRSKIKEQGKINYPIDKPPAFGLDADVVA